MNATEAWALVTRAIPDRTYEERLVVMSIGWYETNFAQGWGTNPDQGAGSNNWGSVQGEGPAGHFMHQDSWFNPKTQRQETYTTKFRKYYTLEQAVQDVARIALKPNVKAACAAHDLHGVSQAMGENKYYTGIYKTLAENVEWHYKRFKPALERCVKSAQLENPFAKASTDPTNPIPTEPPAIPEQPKWYYYFRQARPTADAALITTFGYLSTRMLTSAECAVAIANLKPWTFLAWTSFNPATISWDPWQFAAN